ncbi:hypothetical protein BTR25_07030 [Bacillus sp. MRMR6]|nr:hypothetical protein BTR25_07030 [Bacillus sp. MRMR6]
MVLVCSKHVKDALKIVFIPHVRKVTEEESISSTCQFCSCTANYKLFNYVHKRKKAKEAI